MKVYLAAPYSARQRVKEYADELTRIGYKSTATWLDGTHEINDGSVGAAKDFTDADAAAWAASDLHDLDKADILVAFSAAAACDFIGFTTGGTSGGRHVETGYAIGRGIPVLFVGEPENIFHRYGARVTVVPSWHEAVIELAARLVGNRRPTAVERHAEAVTR